MENASEEYTKLFKLVFIGDTKVGKSNIVSKYANNQLPPKSIPTIGVEFTTKVVKLDDGTTVKLQIWDTAGQERYRAITSTHYRRAAGAIVVYDITKEQTFTNVKTWIEEVRSQEPNIMILLVGNKLDLVEKDPKLREVSTELAQTLAGTYNASFAEMSVFSEKGIYDILGTFAKRLTENAGPKDTLKSVEKEAVKIPETVSIQPEKNVEEDYIMKIVLAGATSVGKTYVLNKYIKGTLPKNNLPTIGVEFATKHITLSNGKVIKSQLWDTAGQERYKAITHTHFRKASGVIVFYDITKEKTFEDVTKWIEEARRNVPDVVGMLVGNKLDLVEKDPSLRAIPRDAVEQMAKDNDMLYEEISAVTGQNVYEIFNVLYQAIWDKNNDGKTPLPQAKEI